MEYQKTTLISALQVKEKNEVSKAGFLRSRTFPLGLYRADLELGAHEHLSLHLSNLSRLLVVPVSC